MAAIRVCVCVCSGWRGRGPNSFGHAKFEVKNFSLYLVLWTVSTGVCAWGGVVWDPTFFGHAKFEVRNFSFYLVLWTLFLQGGKGGSGIQLFLVMPNLRSKIFPFI